MLQTLKDRYEQYREDVRKVTAKARSTDGLFGMGDDPRKDPCHMRFYEDVEQFLREFLKTGPDAQETYEVARWIIAAPVLHRGEATYWFAYAVHGLCKELIPRLDAVGCADLLAFYDENYPKQDRLPVHKELYKLLKKGAGKK